MLILEQQHSCTIGNKQQYANKYYFRNEQNTSENEYQVRITSICCLFQGTAILYISKQNKNALQTLPAYKGV